MKNTTIIIILLLLGAKASGQQVKSGNNASAFSRPLSVQLFAGSQGLGADVKYGLLPELSGRAGCAFIPVDVNRGLAFNSFQTQAQLSARFSNVHLLADYSPFHSKAFRLVGGAAYLIQGQTNITISPSGSYTFGSRTLTGSQIGSVHGSVTWKGIAPYLGFSFFKSFPYRFFNVNLDLGTYYASSPGTSITGTNLLSGNDSNERQFNKNMSGYHWLPVIQLNFNFRIK